MSVCASQKTLNSPLLWKRSSCAVALMRRILDTPGTTWPRRPRVPIPPVFPSRVFVAKGLWPTLPKSAHQLPGGSF